jgi:apolipoprotein N-acyltransferase
MNQSAPANPASFAKLTAPRTTLIPALAGAVLCWLAFPPIGWSYLAWVGPVPWLLLVAQDKLPGTPPYRTLWLGGTVFWLLTVHWIRLPHPLNYIGWVALAAYLGLYLPVFVALARVGVVRWRLPLVLVAPVVWTGLEWFRAHLLTGFLMGSLAHTQVQHLPVIQIADITGEYGVTFLMILVAASLAKTLLALSTRSEPGRPRPRRIKSTRHLLPAAIALCATLYYGQSRIADIKQQDFRPGPKIALIQGNSLADWKSDLQRQQQIMDEHIRLSREAVRSNPDVELVIWPETMFRETLITVEGGYHPPPDRVPPENLTAAQDYLRLLTKELGTAVLVGIDRVHVFPAADGKLDYRSYNSAVLVDAEGNILGTYDKMHRVPFGEFIPFADWFPGLYKLTPITGGIAAGGAAAGLQLNGVLYAPNICYESAVPQLIRRQGLELAEQDGRVPEVLVNLTNDAWFWGSSELDMHLDCGVFRAVEMRIPLVVAANGGLSAYVDSLGTVQEVSRRQTPQVLIADVELLERQGSGLSLYARWGDWFALACVLCCMVLAVGGWRGLRRQSAVAGDGTAR